MSVPGANRAERSAIEYTRSLESHEAVSGAAGPFDIGPVFTSMFVVIAVVVALPAGSDSPGRGALIGGAIALLMAYAIRAVGITKRISVVLTSSRVLVLRHALFGTRVVGVLRDLPRGEVSAHETPGLFGRVHLVSPEWKMSVLAGGRRRPIAERLVHLISSSSVP